MTAQHDGRLAPGAYLGVVVGGSLSEGVEVKLASQASVEEVKAGGTFVVMRGARFRFLGLVTDVTLQSADRNLAAVAPTPDDPFAAQVLAGTTAYGVLNVLPQLTLPLVAGDAQPGEPAYQPARTVPAHFAPTYVASAADIALVFGTEDAQHFSIGNPLDLEVNVCLDMPRFVERSSGVFGKTGTGKSFLTRLLLIGMMQKTKTASLVFDMGNDYGWAGRDRERGRAVKGLKQIAPSRVSVFTLDEEDSRRRGVKPDGMVRISYDQVTPRDIHLLAEMLNLTPLAAQAVYRLARKQDWGKDWLKRFLDLPANELDSLVHELGEHQETLGALHRRLETLRRMPFLGDFPEDQSVQRILENLERGQHVILEFGGHGRSLDAYLFVTNFITSRVYDRWVKRVQAAQSEAAKEPPSLAIVIEEAHKFLSEQVAGLTPFGAIAREGRKFKVSLLVIDQRPSAIDPEVMSQIGTKVVCLLDNEKDVEAALAGAAGKSALRRVLASLESRQQALLFGDAVPIPVAVRVREYGSESSYRELARGGHAKEVSREANGDDLFG
ncbi:MAG: ATP-binding protein [Dehalococcoidia bacterium]|nr:ATP-binding protein [Dehalococcoidia bacterium]